MHKASNVIAKIIKVKSVFIKEFEVRYETYKNKSVA